MVLVGHANRLALDLPEASQMHSNPVEFLFRYLFLVLSVPAVNVFVMISGWFGIRRSIKGACNFLFQCLFLSTLVYTVSVWTDVVPLSNIGLADCLGFNAWFVGAYMGLYVIAPVLNAYVERCTRRQLAVTILAFFSFEIYFGWFGASSTIAGGYSALSFIGLYLLARYLRLYGNRLRKIGGGIFLASSALLFILLYLTKMYGIWMIDPSSYIDPLMIASAAGLILMCSRLKIKHSAVINYIASSAFAVYIIHMNVGILEPLFNPIIRKIYAAENGIACVAEIFLFLVAVFVACVIIDQPRKLIWHYLNPIFFKKSSKSVSDIANPSN